MKVKSITREIESVGVNYGRPHIVIKLDAVEGKNYKVDEILAGLQKEKITNVTIEGLITLPNKEVEQLVNELVKSDYVINYESYVPAVENIFKKVDSIGVNLYIEEKLQKGLYQKFIGKMIAQYDNLTQFKFWIRKEKEFDVLKTIFQDIKKQKKDLLVLIAIPDVETEEEQEIIYNYMKKCILEENLPFLLQKKGIEKTKTTKKGKVVKNGETVQS